LAESINMSATEKTTLHYYPIINKRQTAKSFNWSVNNVKHDSANQKNKDANKTAKNTTHSYLSNNRML